MSCSTSSTSNLTLNSFRRSKFCNADCFRDAISHKLENFAKLEPTLRNLNIKFDSKMVDKIMKNERGVALRLLYQLKMMLEKVYPPTDIAVLAKTGQFGDN